VVDVQKPAGMQQRSAATHRALTEASAGGRRERTASQRRATLRVIIAGREIPAVMDAATHGLLNHVMRLSADDGEWFGHSALGSSQNSMKAATRRFPPWRSQRFACSAVRMRQQISVFSIGRTSGAGSLRAPCCMVFRNPSARFLRGNCIGYLCTASDRRHVANSPRAGFVTVQVPCLLSPYAVDLAFQQQ